MQMMILTEAVAAAWNCFSAARKNFIINGEVEYALVKDFRTAAFLWKKESYVFQQIFYGP